MSIEFVVNPEPVVKYTCRLINVILDYFFIKIMTLSHALELTNLIAD